MYIPFTSSPFPLPRRRSFASCACRRAVEDARADVSQAAPGESSLLASSSTSSSLTTSSDVSSSSGSSTETAATSAAISVSSSSELSTSSSSLDATSRSDGRIVQLELICRYCVEQLELGSHVARHLFGCFFGFCISSSSVDIVLSSSSSDPTLLATSSAASSASALSSSESLATTTSAVSLTSQSSSFAVLTLTSSSSELASSSSVTLSSSTISSSVSISVSEPSTFSTTSLATILSDAESAVSSSTSTSASSSSEISTSDSTAVEVSLTRSASLSSSTISVASAEAALPSSSLETPSTADIPSSSAVPTSITPSSTSGPSSSSAAVASSTETILPTPSASTPTPASAAAATPRTEGQSDPVATPTISDTAASPTPTPSSPSSSSSDITDPSNSSDPSSDSSDVTSLAPATVAVSQPTTDATSGTSGTADDSASDSTSVSSSDVVTSSFSSDVDSTTTSIASDDVVSATTTAGSSESTTTESSDISSGSDGSTTSDVTDVSASSSSSTAVFASSDPEATVTASGDVSATLTLSDALTQASLSFDSTALSTTDTATETASATATSTDDDGDLASRVTSLTGFFSTFTPGGGKAASTQALTSPFPQRIVGSGTSSSDDSTATASSEAQNTPQAVQDTAPSSTTDDSNGDSVSTVPIGNVGEGLTLPSTSGSPTSSLGPSSTVSETNSGVPLADAAKQAMSPATIAGIVISIVGSFALVLVIAFFLLRRRRERARVRALAHESFGPGIPRSGSSQGRHAPSPSRVAFLGIGRSRSQGSNYDDDDGENRGFGAFFARVRGALAPRKENVLREKGVERIREKPVEVYERGLDDGDGSFLPPLAPIRALSPLPPFGGVSSSNVEVTGNVNAVANPFLDPYASNSAAPVEIGRARAPSPSQVPAANVVPVVAPPAAQNDTAPRPDDPFWDPEDLLPPALRLSALKKQTAAWKASPSNSTGPQSESGSSSITTNASVVVPPGLNKVDRTNDTSSVSPRLGLVPHDPFADPGMQLNLDLRNQAASPAEVEDKPVVMPDIFDYRASTTSSDVGAVGGEREGYTSWVSQPGWARSVRSSTSTSSFASVPHQAKVVPPLPAGSTSAYSSSSDGPFSMSGSSVLASSVGSGIGINVDAASNSSLKATPAAGISLGMLRSQSPGGKYDFAFFRDDADGASDAEQRLSYISGESHETGRYQMYGNAL
ncbi:hypothetical protein A7U60_g431 [Sanghuangporus baumii]|uniref:Uncharacterized protein n=1 Tax=Sanghuangporus baumii TaxID=108892 RepID=A0A9Q5NCD4_SANBA|nr:hypothetical protein A7U60_g431 [Sanghuangporus baumii]